jgi:hypothetical protein
MTTTARELAEKILKKLVVEHANGGEAFVDEGYGYYEDALTYFSEAIDQAFARGRESVLKVALNEQAFGYHYDDDMKAWDVFHYFKEKLEKLKEPV